MMYSGGAHSARLPVLCDSGVVFKGLARWYGVDSVTQG